MVDYNPKSWYSLITHSYSRHVMRTLRPALLFMGVYTAVICYLVLEVFHWDELKLQSTTAMHSLLGIVLGLFLVFRTNSAYDRWWEGRRLWGSMVNNTRNFAFKLHAFLPKDDIITRTFFVKMIPNFVVSVKDSLRKNVNLNHFESAGENIEEILKDVRHVPNKLSSLMYNKVAELYSRKIITGDQLFLLDRELKEFSDILGGCERIKNTPIPYSYSMYIKKFIFIYIITLPFGFVTLTQYVTVLIVVLISFVIFSVELIAEEIEDPFGKDINDLPTDELSIKIRDNVEEIFEYQSSIIKV
jgi:putative membrane protein